LLRPLAMLLLAGSLLLLGAASVHPILHGHAADHLATIAATHSWRTIHLLLSLATALIIAGLWCRLLVAPVTLRLEFAVALGLLALGEMLNGLNIAFMTGAGTQLALLNQEQAGLAQTLYQAMHPFTLIAARAGSLLAGLAALMLGRLSMLDPAEARWVVPLPWIAGLAGLPVVLFCSEWSIATPLVIGLLAFWQIAVAARILRGER
jgi:hypothetical protein